jgi:hypothetical protein
MGRGGRSSHSKASKVYAVEKIYRHRTRGGVHEYYVKWVGYPASQNSWEPEENFVAV